MVEDGGCTAFAVVFFDGERDTEVGEVQINPAMEYKPFQLIICQKIGVSHNQVSIYLVDRKRDPEAPISDDRQRIPITGKVNFGWICRQKDCFFLVVLRKSRKARNRRERALENKHSHQSTNVVLLQRNQQPPIREMTRRPELADFNNRLRRSNIQTNNYLIAMAKGSQLVPNMSIDSTNDKTSKAVCEECVNAAKKGSTAAFHHCINDAVVTRFTARLGPINRPDKPLHRLLFWKLLEKQVPGY